MRRCVNVYVQPQFSQGMVSTGDTSGLPDVRQYPEDADIITG